MHPTLERNYMYTVVEHSEVLTLSLTHTLGHHHHSAGSSGRQQPRRGDLLGGSSHRHQYGPQPSSLRRACPPVQTGLCLRPQILGQLLLQVYRPSSQRCLW